MAMANRSHGNRRGPSKAIRLPSDSYDVVRGLAQAMGVSMQDVVAQAVKDMERRRFFEAANASYARLQQDPMVWAEYRAAFASMEGTLGDGLPLEPPGSISEWGGPGE